MPKTYSPASFTRDYDATHVCTGGQVPVWRLYSWSALTPGNSSISFSIATATTLAGLATATTYPLGWSSPPGVPTGLMAGHPATAQAGTPNTDLDSASPDSTLLANMLPQNNFYLRVIATLNPTSTLLQAPTLSSWDMQIDCIDNN